MQNTIDTIIKNEIYTNQTTIVEAMLVTDNSTLLQWEDIENRSEYHYSKNNESYLITEAEYCVLNDIDVSDCDIEETFKDIFQWYSVTPWLADKLHAIDEPVIRLPNVGYWWGITNYGIPLEDQPALIQIAKELDNA